jgi:DNA-3-methyladenine glycosylase II
LLRCTIALPHDFRAHDFFEFHGRDAMRVAECVDGHTLHKGLVWAGRASCLTLALHQRQVAAELASDGPVAAGAALALENMVRRMLGLTQPVAAFEHAHRAHAQLGPLIVAHAGLRVPLAATPFEALTWAVTGQQISLGAAVALRRKLIRMAGLKHTSGLCCYPDAARLAALAVDDLRTAGFSQTKAHTLITLAQQVQSQQLPLDDWLLQPLPAEEAGARLLSIRGIGPWTVNYTLLRGYGWLDGSLHGDAAVCRGLQSLLGSQVKVDADQARLWLAQFSPWRALVAAHLWALNADLAGTHPG